LPYAYIQNKTFVVYSTIPTIYHFVKKEA